ncbi:MAG: TIGR02444 family protein [Halioglobus sp.]|nr:TIGR02444 family protein [Halioglobus sp.]
MSNNPLWDYSIATYSLEGVAPACLALQDNFGLDVNVLFYASWLAQLERLLSHDHLAGMEALITDWRSDRVKPLRALRIRWRQTPQAGSLRDQIKSLELRAERQQQNMMYSYCKRSAELPWAERPLRENLALVASFAGPDCEGRSAAIEHLARLFSS